MVENGKQPFKDRFQGHPVGIHCVVNLSECPPDELSIVVRFLGQQFDFPPVKELVQGGEGILGDGTFISVTPHFQAHQGNPNVQGPVELKGSILISTPSVDAEGKGRRFILEIRKLGDLC